MLVSMAREHTLRILHLSDLHARGSREPAPWRRRRVLGPAWEQNLDALREDGSFDLLCMTGDLAFSGDASEYAEVTDFLMATLDRLGMQRDRLFLVPGNHDVHRDTEADAWRELRGHMSHHDAAAFSHWLAGGKAPRGVDDGLRDLVLRRQADYRDWLEHTLQRGELLPARSPHQRLGYRKTLRLPGQPFDIHVLGLDSAWLAGDDADSRNLWLTEDQVMRLATDDRGNPLPGFRLALIHHPLTDLADGEHCRRLLAGSAAGTRPLVDLLLRGHLHETEPETWADPERTLRQLAAGCLYESDRYPNACIAMTVKFDDTGRPLRHELRFRGWSQRGHWFDDNSLYPNTRDGRLLWRMARRPEAAATPQPQGGESIIDLMEALKASLETSTPKATRPIAASAPKPQRGEIVDLMKALKASMGAPAQRAPEVRKRASGRRKTKPRVVVGRESQSFDKPRFILADAGSSANATAQPTTPGPLLTWIHLSDIHFGHGDTEHGWDQRLVLETLSNDLAEQCQQRPPNVIFVTGDIAFSGKPEQYAHARAWFEKIGRTIGLGPEHMFTVPGNHDVDRAADRNRDIARLLRELRAGHENLDAALAHSADREKLMARMAGYLDFASGFAPERARATPRPPRERLFWQHRESRGDLVLRIVGLNTAILSADDLDQGRLALGKEQVTRGLVEPPREPGELVIVMSHHPLQGGWLADEREMASWLSNRADVHLCGHVHEAASEDARSGSGSHFVRIAAGAAHADKQPSSLPASHGYNISSLFVKPDGKLCLRIWPRLWSAKHAGFVVDIHNVPRGQEYAEHSLRVALPTADAVQRADRGAASTAHATASLRVSTPTHVPAVAHPPESLAQVLKDALQRKQKLEAAGLPTDSVLAEIREFKREHRRGGQLRSGDVLSDRYLLAEQIGRGGFATVWRARDSATNEDVAIKVLHPELAGDVIRHQRFFRGARIMAELAHPMVVRILEREAEDDGFFYFVMSFIEGGNLQDAVFEQRVKREQAVPIILSIGEALAEAHARGHVHRDIKPMNILVTESGEPRLTDFDLVTAHDTTGGTRTGALGTFIYAAPEMMERPQEADARADVYGLAMTMAFMLHGGRLPRKALTARERFIEDLGCASVLEAVLKQATGEDPEERYPDASAFCEALRAATSLGSPVLERVQPENVEQSVAREPKDTRLLRFMVKLPGGTFWMGSVDDDAMADESEKPIHQVEVSPFHCMKYPVTRWMWRTLMGKDKDWWPEGSDDDLPANMVSWFDAMRFCNALSERSALTPCYRIEGDTVEWVSSHGYRLPTEAEWEYACRAGSQTHWCFGDDGRELGEYAWYDANADAPQPVGQKKPNAWGLHDMHGNVWEWCWDWDATYPDLFLEAPLLNPRGPRQGSLRILRGGSFAYTASHVRCADRLANWPADRGKNWGFRCVRGPAPTTKISHKAKAQPRRRLANISDEEIRDVLQEHGWEIKAAADALSIARETLYERIWASDIMRKAKDVSSDELRQAFDECGGDRDTMANRLRISKAALKARMKKLGFE
jgi:formylglycine-generating enzyme required for sulfatase activity/3',5'-cyclic AMP phosphodiesterase CpdA